MASLKAGRYWVPAAAFNAPLKPLSLLAMNLRHLATLLLAVGLLLSTLGCSKKEDAKPASPSGSYKFDGVLKQCVVKCAVSTVRSSTYYYDELTVTLTPISQPASGRQSIELHYHKSPGGPSADYQLAVLLYTDDANSSSKVYTIDRTTLQEVTGSYAGTFAGSAVYIGYTPLGPHTITEGVFADVRP